MGTWICLRANRIGTDRGYRGSVDSDHKDVQVASGVSIAACPAAEEDHLLRLCCLNDQAENLTQQCVNNLLLHFSAFVCGPMSPCCTMRIRLSAPLRCFPPCRGGLLCHLCRPGLVIPQRVRLRFPRPVISPVRTLLVGRECMSDFFPLYGDQGLVLTGDIAGADMDALYCAVPLCPQFVFHFH
jgi:hypothetical protein